MDSPQLMDVSYHPFIEAGELYWWLLPLGIILAGLLLYGRLRKSP